MYFGMLGTGNSGYKDPEEGADGPLAPERLQGQIVVQTLFGRNPGGSLCMVGKSPSNEEGFRESEGMLSAPWRLRLLGRLELVLVVFELVLSVIFLSLSFLSGSIYLKGVGVGLVIAWVTSGIAYVVKRRVGTSA
jgi:hypothetical protein